MTMDFHVIFCVLMFNMSNYIVGAEVIPINLRAPAARTREGLRFPLGR